MNCPHTNRKLTLTPELKHHGREDCTDCGRFIRWVPKPESIERDMENASRIAFLKTQPLSDWEKGFIHSLEQQKHFSPKQQAKLIEVFHRYEKNTR